MFLTWLNNVSRRRDAYQIRQADNLIKRQKFDKALSVIKGIRLDETNERSLTNLVLQCVRADTDITIAFSYFNSALEEGYYSESLFLALAETYEKAGDTWKQFYYLLEAVKINCDSVANSIMSRICGTRMDFRTVSRTLDKYFDPKFYRATYGDIRDANVDPLTHYALWGWRENRRPNANFDPVRFMKLHGHTLHSEDIPIVTFYERLQSSRKLNLPETNDLWLKLKAYTDLDWESVSQAKNIQGAESTVILPVYKGLNETMNSIWHALKSRGDDKYELLVINDCSPDPVLSAEIKRLSDLGMFNYILNDNNLGFVRTINTAIQSTPERNDIVLLNSDAYVFDGWYARLSAHAKCNTLIGTVTPLSNNATICSYPKVNFPNIQDIELSPEAVDRITSEVNRGVAVDTPTGVGFCFYMTRPAIDAVGLLDSEAFKIGYGEECDFCMRALNAGFRNLIAADVFVYHIGSVSFDTIKDFHFNRGQETIQRRHVNYSTLVDAHVQSDPLSLARSNIDLERVASHFRGNPIIITHSEGGGVEKYVRDHRQKLISAGLKPLVVRVFGLDRLTFDFGIDSDLFFNLDEINLPNRYSDILNFFTKINPTDIYINSFYGLDWLSQETMIDLLVESKLPLKYICHDYSMISHNYHLCRSDLLYVDLRSGAPYDRRSSTMSGHLDEVPLPRRREAYSKLFAATDTVIAPSAAAGDFVRNFYPEVTISVVEHEDALIALDRKLVAQPAKARDRLVIACLGAIGPHKGSFVIQSLATYIQNNQLPIDLHIVGHSDRDNTLKVLGVSITGRYNNDDEAIDFLDNICPDVFFIPSIWPETYCYALSFGIALGIPLAVFDLGAQSERSKRVPSSIILPTQYINHPAGLAQRFLDFWEELSMKSREHV